jgi:hypothetical protein
MQLSEDVVPVWDRNPLKTARRLIAAAFVVLTALLVALSYLPNSVVAACRQQLDTADRMVTVCRPIGTDDVILIGLLLLVTSMFIAPDISELGIGTVISLKKAVREAGRKADKAADRVDALAAVQPKPDLAGTLRSLESKSEDVASARTAAVAERAPSDEQAAIKAELVTLLRQVASYDQAGRFLYRRFVTADGRSLRGIELQAVRDWRSRFGPEIANFLSLDAMLTHPERFTDADLRHAVDVGRGLIKAAVDAPTRRVLEQRAFEWVIRLEKKAGREPVEATPELDLLSPPRSIEIKGTAQRHAKQIFLTANEAEQLRRPGHFLYVVENIAAAKDNDLTIKVIRGTSLVSDRPDRVDVEAFPSYTEPEALAGPLRDL